MKIENPITLMDILSSTGLEIKADPGIVLIYFGFLFLMISTLISYITYSQIWIVQDKKKIFILQIYYFFDRRTLSKYFATFSTSIIKKYHK